MCVHSDSAATNALAQADAQLPLNKSIFATGADSLISVGTELVASIYSQDAQLRTRIGAGLNSSLESGELEAFLNCCKVSAAVPSATGWLQKRYPARDGKWEWRWCVLSPATRLLAYYADETCRIKKGCVPIRPSAELVVFGEIDHVENIDLTDCSKGFMLDVGLDADTHRRLYFFRSEYKWEIDKWIEAIRFAASSQKLLCARPPGPENDARAYRYLAQSECQETSQQSTEDDDDSRRDQISFSAEVSSTTSTVDSKVAITSALLGISEVEEAESSRKQFQKDDVLTALNEMRDITDKESQFRSSPEKASKSWSDLWQEMCSGDEIPVDDEGAVAAFSLWRNKPAVAERNWMSWIFQARAECSQLTTAIRNGISPTVRGDMWYTCSDAAGKQRREEHSYSELIAIGYGLGDIEAVRIIEADLPRTGIEGIDQGLLRNVLLAFAAGNPQIGYCQAMNFIAGTLLQHLEEERAFWTLRRLLEDLLPPDYFTTGMAGLRTDLKVLHALLQEHLPSLHAHLESEQVDLTPITMNWFLCLFLNTLPVEIAYRVVDCVMHEGSEILFRVALSLLQQTEPELLEATSLPDVYMILRTPYQISNEIQERERVTSESSSDSLRNGDELFGRMYGSWLDGWSAGELARLREIYMPAVRAEDSIAAAKRDARKRDCQDSEDDFVWTRNKREDSEDEEDSEDKLPSP